jgi:hypothetical protein
MKTIPAYSQNAPILQVSTDNIYLKAGQENIIKIILENTGNYKIIDIQSFLSSSIPGITVLTQANQVISEIKPDSTKSYEPTLYIDQSIPLGAYSLSLSISYKRTGAVVEDSLEVPIGFIISEVFTPKIIYTPTPEENKLSSGTVNEAKYRFTNNQNESLYNLTIVLNSQTSSITITDKILTTIEKLDPYESFTLFPKISIIEGTALGTYSLTATATYEDKDGNKFHQTYSLPINIASTKAIRNTLITIEEMKVIEKVIRPGDIFTIEITAKCTGAEAYDLLSKFGFSANGQISPISPSVVSLGDINVDETTIAIYTLLASGDIAAGQYSVMITITYTNSRGVINSITETFTILIDGLIDFELLDVPSNLASPGMEMNLEADLLLVGTESVDFVSIEILEEGVVKRVSGSNEYIGAVDPDSPIPFDIKYKIDEDSQIGKHNLGLVVKYKDHLNRENEERISLDLEIVENVDEEPQTQRTGFWAWIRRLFGFS